MRDSSNESGAIVGVAWRDPNHTPDEAREDYRADVTISEYSHFVHDLQDDERAAK